MRKLTIKVQQGTPGLGSDFIHVFVRASDETVGFDKYIEGAVHVKMFEHTVSKRITELLCM